MPLGFSLLPQLQEPSHHRLSSSSEKGTKDSVAWGEETTFHLAKSHETLTSNRMATQGPRDEGESDAKDRLPQQTSLDTTSSPPPMSAAVASAELKRSEPSGGTLVMNPLVPSLPRRSSLHSFSDAEPSLKKRKISENGLPATTSSPNKEEKAPAPAVSENNSSCDSIQSRPVPVGDQPKKGEKDHKDMDTENQEKKDIRGGGDASSEPEANNTIKAPDATTAAAATTTTLKSSAAVATSTATATTTDDTKPAAAASVPAKTTATSSQGSLTCANPPENPPLKSTKMAHLRQKYTGELEYMLREFEKLERQLLGARKTEESAASRERREKLHSFILHLTETIQQIEKGCQLEAAGKSTLSATQQITTQEAALANPSQDKEEEENVQKLEEHILANLLPVKVRLKKQLAAQQGAKHNPATMPHRGGHGVPAPAHAGSTFADSAKRQQEAAKVQESMAPVAASPVAPDQTQFGKPLVKGSSLTKKLHGPTLGSSERAHGDGVGAPETSAVPSKKKYYGGLAVGSAQMESSFDAASNVHKIVIQDPALVKQSQAIKEEPKTETLQKDAPPSRKAGSEESASKPTAVVQFSNEVGGGNATSDERRRKLRQKKRKKMRLKEQAKAAAAEKRELEKGRKQKAAKKSHRGPRHVEYMCALCNEVYNSTCDYNPWWALAQHDCPKCRKRQIPKIDIGAPANAIEYHPALLAHAEDNGGVTPAERCVAADVAEVGPSDIPSNGELSEDDSIGGSDISSEYGDISTDEDDDSLDSEIDEIESLSPAERAEQERFGADYAGPTLEAREASRLLILMSHASTCPCQHKSHDQRETCRSAKWMMLHVRDCPGTTSNFDVCPFPWCRKVKHLLYHLVSCQEPEKCKICAPSGLGLNLLHLRALNDHRAQSYRQKLLAKFSPPALLQSETANKAIEPVATSLRNIVERSQENESIPADKLNQPRPAADQGSGKAGYSDNIEGPSQTATKAEVQIKQESHSDEPNPPILPVTKEEAQAKAGSEVEVARDVNCVGVKVERAESEHPGSDASDFAPDRNNVNRGSPIASTEKEINCGEDNSIGTSANSKQDAENNKGEESKGGRAPTPEKNEELTTGATDGTSIFNENTNTGETTMELLKVK